MSPGEIRRTLERIERQHSDAQRAMDDRLTKLAADMVPTALWASQHQAVVEDVRHNEADMREAMTRAEATAQERMATLRGEVASVRKGLSDHNKRHETDTSWSRSKRLTVAAIVVGATATLIGAWIAAFAAAGGVR
jgi:hypothetical protein